jgi:hypothetical protein
MATVVDEIVALLGYKYTGQADAKRFQQDLDIMERKAQAVGRAIGAAAAVMTTAFTAGIGGLLR